MGTETDIRIAAWSFGRRAGTAAAAFRHLEAGTPEAVRVFAALSAREWGVEAAFRDGLRGVNIEARDPRTGITVAFTGGEPLPEPAPSRVVVAANGGTVWAN